jgi:protein-L-isoaspartate(D-aspartate) O-methyltransferase
MESPATTDTIDVVAMRHALVDKLKGYGPSGVIRTLPVEAAFRAVPRHLFVPDAPLDKVYSDDVISTKQQDGVSISASSQPAIMAIMLEQLDLQPGQRVLEIGAGTGYNAALMAHIVGDTGHVVAVDIDQDIVDGARAHLDAASFGRVQVFRADGALGYPEAAPYDRIILTVGAADILPAWREQLRPGGRLVLPLLIRARQLSLALEDRGDHLESVSASVCGFMPLRGAFAVAPGDVQLGPEPGLSLFVENAGRVDAGNVYTWLMTPARDHPLEVLLAPSELGDGLTTWLEAWEPGFCTLVANGELSRRGIVPWLWGLPGKFCGTNGVLGPDSLAVLMIPPDRVPAPGAAEPAPPPPSPPEPPRPLDLLVRDFGPDETAGRRLSEHVRAWDAAGRPSSDKLRIRAYPQPGEYPPGPHEAVVEKQWTRLVLDWR